VKVIKLWLKSSDQYCIILTVTIGLVNDGNMCCCLFDAVSFSLVKKKKEVILLYVNAQYLYL